MHSQYIKANYIPNIYGKMKYYIPNENKAYEYLQYLQKIPTISVPVYYNEQNNFYDLVECEKPIEHYSNEHSKIDTSSNSFAKYSDINKCDNSVDSNYANKEPSNYRQNNLNINISNSVSNYSMKNNSVINSSTPLVNNISNFKQVVCEPNIDNNSCDNSLNKPKENIYNNSILPNEISISKNYDKSSNPSGNIYNDSNNNITLFEFPQSSYNYASEKNLQYLEERKFPWDININSIHEENKNNNNFCEMNYLNNNAKDEINTKQYESHLIKNNPNICINNDSKKIDESSDNITIKNPQQIKASDINSNKTINQNSFSSFIYDNSKEKLLNYNQSNNKVIRNFFEPSSNTPLLSSPALNIPYNNLNESSSQKNEIVTDFKDLSIEEKNIQEIKDNLKDDKNELNNPSINLPNNNFNQINNNLLFNQQSSLIKTKSNLISNNIKEHKPSDKYSQYMLEQINKIRTNPRSYISKLKKAEECLKQDKNGNVYYPGKIKVVLYRGKQTFEEVISSLEKMKPMKPLIYKTELCLKISDNKFDFTNGGYLKRKINELINRGVKVRAFWKDSVNAPEFNLLLMIINSNPLRKTVKIKDVLNPEFKYIGINSGMLDQYFVCYTVLSD